MVNGAKVKAEEKQLARLGGPLAKFKILAGQGVINLFIAIFDLKSRKLFGLKSCLKPETKFGAAK